MPTSNRRAFVPDAIAQFLQQDFPDKELLILDDGTDAVADLVPAEPSIRYLRLEPRRVLGAKRNLACEQARGEVLLHWDDDDWHAPWRVRYQVEALRAAGADACGLDQVWFYEPTADRAWRYVYPRQQRPWLCGGTLCYTRAFWRQQPFPELHVGEDTRFVWRHAPARLLALPDTDFYVARVHPQNTSPKRTSDPRYRPVPGEQVRRLLGASAPREPAWPAPPSPLLAPAPLASASPPMKLNLGCCDALLPGYVNVDLCPAPGVEVADLRQPWPWPDDSVEQVRAWDIIEHLPDARHTMNELWRVLRPNGTAEIAVPTTDGPGAFQDPTHVSFWNRRSFLYYEAGNPYRERFARPYGIRAKFRTVREQTTLTPDGPRLTIVLQAVKP